jgi:hypothetical protein
MLITVDSVLLTAVDEEQPAMGVVLPFEPRATKRTIARRGASHQLDTIDGELALMAAQHEGRNRRGILAAARPLLQRCRDLGFTVMRPGLPADPAILACALLTLAQGLRPLGAELAQSRPFWAFGVYFDRRELAWFEDGYGGTTGLAVPIGIDAAKLTQFVQHRVRALCR